MNISLKNYLFGKEVEIEEKIPLFITRVRLLFLDYAPSIPSMNKKTSFQQLIKQFKHLCICVKEFYQYLTSIRLARACASESSRPLPV